MGQSLHLVFGHLVFSTKGREGFIEEVYEERLRAYVGGIIRELGGSLIAMNGMPDHVHLLFQVSKSVADMEFVKQVKGSSSRWMKDAGCGRFAWQSGYGWFGVSVRDLDAAKHYVARQKEHHRREGFQDEYRRFLERYGVEYDERYVWD